MFDKQPTDKQMDLIHDMKDYGVYKFTGTTRQDASNYISENMEYFKEQKKFMN